MRIALAGEALIDFTGTGPLAFQGHVGGAVLNAAVACARLGQPTAYLTQVSSDLFGAQILAYLQANGVDTRHVLVDEAPSTLAFVERTPTTNRYAFYRTGAADTRWAPAALREPTTTSAPWATWAASRSNRRKTRQTPSSRCPIGWSAS